MTKTTSFGDCTTSNTLLYAAMEPRYAERDAAFAQAAALGPVGGMQAPLLGRAQRAAPALRASTAGCGRSADR